MRRSGTSAYALTLVKPRSTEQRTTEVVQIDGRDRVARRGIYFAVVGRHRRSVFQQFNGSVELADLCTCACDWEPKFSVQRNPGCVIDQHRMQAIQADEPRGVA